jgi:UDP-N-acetylmuramate: L-alanyl-gamma-D-glutamyl-meso-diaminopimelate ligase
VFQQDFARAFAESTADEVIIAAVFRATLPDAERLQVDALVRDVNAAGVHARELPDVPAIVSTIAAEARAGDLVIIMSNGGFDGIHDKLLGALKHA